MDIFETTLVCDKCNIKTEKKVLDKEGFEIRSWRCPSCKKLWHHPKDIDEYDKWKRLKEKEFQVKLRLIGNSVCVSIPKEIIEFEEMAQQIDKMVKMSLKEPGRLTLYFSKKTMIVKRRKGE